LALKLAIVTQDPANRGGVLRLVEYIYKRALAVGYEPAVVHYARFAEHPELNASLLNLTRGELNLRPTEKHYEFEGMHARAIGATLPEWEPNRIRANRLWKKALDGYDKFILVTGSAHAGLPLAQSGKQYAAWVSSTVETDRSERLKNERGLASKLEKLSLSSVEQSEKKVLRKTGRILAVSDDAKKNVSALAGKQVEVWPFPIDTEKFKSRWGNIEPRFVFVGRANDPRKRIELFLRAFEELGGDYRATVVSSARPTRIPNNVEIVSGLSDAQLVHLYATTAAFVLSSEQEGLGIAAMEAMACGLPVISTRCGGPETFIEDNVSGFFVSDDPREIAQRMRELVTNSELRSRMGEASRSRIENNFSERVWNTKFEELLSSLP
jgi:glycosyltransferase involved in cell wall biosynthesis